MDESRYREAQEAYDAGDYRVAAKRFLAAAGSGGEGSGVAYHMAGNALMRLRRYTDAATVYGHALRDESYARRSAVSANRGAAEAALGNYAEAVSAYDAALADADYPSRYKALKGKAGALYEMARFDEACSAYREAALADDNPDPGSAFNNLGLCHMAQGRLGDAVEAYKEALRIDSYEGRGKVSSNLGLAYAAMGSSAEAVRAFEQATQRFGYTLPAEAASVYESSRAALPPRETVEGWITGEMPAVGGGSTAVTGAPDAAPAPAPATPVMTDTGSFPGVQEPVTEFFTRTDEDMRAADKLLRQQERSARRQDGGPSRGRLLRSGGIVAAVVAALAVAYFFGLGWPTQTQTVNSMMKARADRKDVARYWVAVPASDVGQEMAKLPASYTGYSIAGVERAPRTSHVSLTVTLSQGSPLRYAVTLTREGVGWKVSGVENDWSAAGGGS